MKRAHLAKFKRLRNGAWGVIVTGPQAGAFAGRTIPVTKRDKSETTVTTSKLLWTGPAKFGGGQAAIYSIAGKTKTEAASTEAADGTYAYDRETAEYMAGRNEVAQIQAISAPGSALREQLYMEMEQRNYNLGLDG